MAIISVVPKVSEYFPKNTIFNIVFEYFNKCLNHNSVEFKRINSLKLGSFEKYYLTNDIFAIEQVFMTKDRKNCFIESHKQFVDFQLVLSGTEQMEYIDISKLHIKKQYNEDNDLIIYDMVDNCSKILLSNSDIAIFFPEDAHIGLPMYQQEELVRKTVIKLPIKYLDKGV